MKKKDEWNMEPYRGCSVWWGREEGDCDDIDCFALIRYLLYDPVLHISSPKKTRRNISVDVPDLPPISTYPD
jgi:hypothetical protein